jgi:hypothetical protein
MPRSGRGRPPLLQSAADCLGVHAHYGPGGSPVSSDSSLLTATTATMQAEKNLLKVQNIQLEKVTFELGC